MGQHDRAHWASPHGSKSGDRCLEGLARGEDIIDQQNGTPCEPGLRLEPRGDGPRTGALRANLGLAGGAFELQKAEAVKAQAAGLAHRSGQQHG